MLVIEEAKLPPPTPVIAAKIISVVYETPGLISSAAGIVGRSSSAALMIVQLRPPKVATASVYGSRSTEPISAGTAARRDFPAAPSGEAGPTDNTSTEHIVPTGQPPGSAKIAETTLCAGALPPAAPRRGR